jgi:hypothetical protein
MEGYNMPKKVITNEEESLTRPMNFYQFIDTLSEKICFSIDKQKKISSIAGFDEDVHDVLLTAGNICSLGKYDEQVVDEHGISHSIDEYEIGGQFENIVTSRGITIDDSEEALDLREFEYNKNYAQFEPSIIMSELDDDDKQLFTSFTKYQQVRTVPLTPGEFKAAQVRIVNMLKGKIERWTSIKELSNPTTFNTIKVFLDTSSRMVSLPTGEISTLPIPVTIFSMVYPVYKCAMPLEEYLDKFAFNFVNGLA